VSTNILLRAGQELTLRRIAPADQRASLVFQNMNRLGLTPDRVISIWVAHVDAAGMSVHINRHGAPAIEGFLPAKNIRWSAYFEPLRAIVPGYATGRHFTKVFPGEFS
jgi:hypothetical protein